MRCGRRRVTGVRDRKESDFTADRGAGAKLATVLGRNRGRIRYGMQKFRLCTKAAGGGAWTLSSERQARTVPAAWMEGAARRGEPWRFGC